MDNIIFVLCSVYLVDTLNPNSMIEIYTRKWDCNATIQVRISGVARVSGARGQTWILRPPPSKKIPKKR